MKKIILGVALTMQLFAAEPISFGAAHGDIKFNTPSLLMYPSHTTSFAGNTWMYKNNKDVHTYIAETKADHIVAGLEEAKKYASEKNKKYYAIDNVIHQVIMDESRVIVTTDYNVLVFD